jgi:hypothetical protein
MKGSFTFQLKVFFPLCVIVGVVIETSKRAGNGFVKTSAMAVGGQSLLAAATAMSSPGRRSRYGSTQLQEFNSAPCFVQKLLTKKM